MMLMWGSPPKEADFWRDIRFVMALGSSGTPDETRGLLDPSRPVKSKPNKPEVHVLLFILEELAGAWEWPFMSWWDVTDDKGKWRSEFKRTYDGAKGLEFEQPTDEDLESGDVARIFKLTPPISRGILRSRYHDPGLPRVVSLHSSCTESPRDPPKRLLIVSHAGSSPLQTEWNE